MATTRVAYKKGVATTGIGFSKDTPHGKYESKGVQKTMFKINHLEINHFRGMEHLALDFQEQINILIGDNGSGKSAILDCIAAMLFPLIQAFYGKREATGSITDQDITNGKTETHPIISVQFHGKPFQWEVRKVRDRDAEQTSAGLDGLLEDISETGSVPLIVHYPVNRLVFDIPLQVRTNHSFDKKGIYDGIVGGKLVNFKVFFEWFRCREDLENEARLDDPGYRDPQLEAVRRAIERLLPGFTGLRVRRSPTLRMTIRKNDEELIVNQLSDGEKCLLALVGDLAWQMAVANDHDNPLEEHAVVLIDEVDLHLHPSWQREIVPALTRTFPNGQFVLTTHSPQILSHVKPENIIGLRRVNNRMEKFQPEAAYGLDSNRILEDMMGVPERPRLIKEELSKLFLTINQGKLGEARKMMGSLMQHIGDDPELVKAGAIIRRKEIIGR